MPDFRSSIANFVPALKNSAASAATALSAEDGRWALVSSAFTASVTLSMTILALSSAPPLISVEGVKPQGSSVLELVSKVAGTRIGGGRFEQLGLIAPPSITAPARRLVEVAAMEAPPVPELEIRTLRIGEGGTIMGMLEEAGIGAKDANAIVAAIAPLYSPRSIRSGQTFEATFGSPGGDAPSAAAQSGGGGESVDERTRRLLSLSFEPSIEHQIAVSLDGGDGYSAHDIHRKLEGRYQHAGGAIHSSLYLSAVQAGIPASVMAEMIRIFSYDVDFQRDVHPGDSFEIFYNHFFTEEGRAARPGDIVAAAMTLSGRTHTLYRYESGGETEYFDPSGKSSKSLLMKTPVDGARISSAFGTRSHPILGYTRMHKGVDFAVPKGSPVVAAGNGTVTYSGNAGGFGNLIVVSHAAGYTTAYAHLSKFLVREGMRVRQGQTIGQSGMTGLATGPHLHYEVRMKGTQINPTSIKVASGRTLTGSALVAFLAERKRVDTLMASVPVQQKLAFAAGLTNPAD